MTSEAISHYRIIRKLGSGGMGEVYLAEDIRLGRRVALKLLSDQFAADEDRLRRFEQEARAASALNHPNIITIHEVGLENSTRFITTEYIEGETLRQHISRKRMSLSEVLDAAIQMAGALAAAHQAGIVHRDIKPENIMLRPDGYVKVLDFGIVKLTEEFADQRQAATDAPTQDTTVLVKTESNAVLGSPSYMSPEQARGLTIDERTDIFSLGVVLYEMIAGRRPFSGTTASDVIVSILDRTPPPIKDFASDLPEEMEYIVAKALRKDREERYQNARDLIQDLRAVKQRLDFEAELQRSTREGPVFTSKFSHAFETTKQLAVRSEEMAGRTTSSAEYIITELKHHKKTVALFVVVAAIVTAVVLFYFNKPQPLTERDTILIADFANTTGDPVFDGTLKQALAVQLEQSPFLNIFSDERVRETLRYMNRQPDERLTIPIAREIAARQGLKAMLFGGISSLGSNYVITLEAMNSQTGDVVAREQVEAERKEQVLKALGSAASSLREKLGESLPTIKRFDAPIEQATTSSLEALKSYSLGYEQQSRARYLEAIPFYRRAIEMDPNFALAHTQLAVAYDNSRQPEMAAEYAAKAFELRARVSEREKLYISWRYYSGTTRELDKAIEVLELWKQTYPRDVVPPNSLSFYYSQIGQYERAIEEARLAIELNPSRPQPYSNLGLALMGSNRLDEAQAVYERALSQNLDSTGYHWGLYSIGFIRGDTELMRKQVEWLAGKPNEFEAVSWEAKSAAAQGQMARYHELSRRAIEMAQSRDLGEVAGQFAARAELRDAMAGNCDKQATDAAGFPRSNPATIDRALALALCGEVAGAQSLIEEQARRFPKDTILNMIWLPTIRGAMELRRNDPARAIQLLQQTVNYEMGYAAGFWPVYIRGQAYLRQRAGQRAAAEFQKILDNRGAGMDSNLYPLAHLGLARAAAIAGDTGQSRKSYEEFFALWKDADPAIPVLKEARQEYQRLP